MKAECAWCGKSLGVRPGPDDKTTHGICEECMIAVIGKSKINHESTKQGKHGG